jgi:hypothetical protein
MGNVVPDMVQHDWLTLHAGHGQVVQPGGAK